MTSLIALPWLNAATATIRVTVMDAAFRVRRPDAIFAYGVSMLQRRGYTVNKKTPISFDFTLIYSSFLRVLFARREFLRRFLAIARVYVTDSVSGWSGEIFTLEVFELFVFGHANRLFMRCSGLLYLARRVVLMLFRCCFFFCHRFLLK